MLSIAVPFNSPLHKKLITAVRARIKASLTAASRSNAETRWTEADKKAVAYLPEKAADTVRRSSRDKGNPEYTTIQIPYSYAVLLTSHTYWTTVFLARNPIIQMQGLHGEGEDQVLAVEAMLNYQSHNGGHLPYYHTFLYDAGKYGDGIVGIYWDEEEHYVSEVLMSKPLTFAGIEIGPPKKVRETRLIRGYEGNKIYNVRPFDFFHDPRVTMREFQKGEFCGTRVDIPWNRLVEGKERGKYINLEHIKKRKGGASIIDDRGGITEAIDLPKTDTFGSQHVDGGLAGDSIPAYEMYIELIPQDWGLGKTRMPEKWVITVTADYTTIISAQPLGYNHNKFPFIHANIEPEGYATHNRGIPTITRGIQDTMDWLLNSHFYNVRKTLNNEYLIDPSKVEMKDILGKGLPGGLIRLKPSAYGTDPRLAMHQLETTDITRGNIADIRELLALGERITGVNDQVMGIANFSSRRSATEVRSSNTFSVNRLKTVAEYMSAASFSPLSKMLVQNSQQFYDVEKKFRLVGNLAAMAGEKFVNVTPDDIAGFYEFVPVDGTLPVDRFAQANLWRALLGEMRQIPALMMTYDVSRIFSYVAQLTGLKNIDQFKVQVAEDGVLQQQAQQGNVVPLGGPNGPEPGQVEGAGKTL